MSEDARNPRRVWHVRHAKLGRSGAAAARNAFAAAILVAGGVISGARGETLTLDYLVGWGHLTIAEAAVSYSQSPARYRLAGDGRTRGILEVFVSWTGQAETEGLLQADGRRPLVHRSQGSWNDAVRRTHVYWDGEAAPRTEAEPPPDLEKVTPVPKGATAATSDPLTVALSVLDGLAATGRCEAEARIWDGRRRYDVTVRHLGEERLTADRPWTYDGPATLCAIDFERIGGFWREASRWRKDETKRRHLVWAAEILPGRWALVRVEIETRYGPVIGRLQLEKPRESRGMPDAAETAFAQQALADHALAEPRP